MRTIFSACAKVLAMNARAYHYRTLTKLAMDHLGVGLSLVHWEKQIEDVREKLCEAGQYGIRYTGKPRCLAFLKRWVDTGDGKNFSQTSFSVDCYEVVVNITHAVKASVEAQMRSPYMIKKTNASPERRAEGCSAGLLQEEAIKDYFREHWPEFYRPPSNERRWTQPAEEDFFLQLPKNLLRIDVSGETLSGQHKNPGKGKKAVDLHLLTRIGDSNTAIWHGIQRGRDYRPGILPLWKSLSPDVLRFYLNCLQDGIPYQDLVEAARSEAAA